MAIFTSISNFNSGIISDSIKTTMNIPYATTEYVEEVLGLNNSMYFPHEHQKQLRELLMNVSNEDAKKILYLLFSEITREENKQIVLSKDIEAAIISMNVDTL